MTYTMKRLLGAVLRAGRAILEERRMTYVMRPVEKQVARLLSKDAELRALWTHAPCVRLVPAARKYGNVEFMIVNIYVEPGAPSREDVWNLLKRVFAKVLASGALEGLLGLEVRYSEFAGRPPVKTVLSVCTASERIPQLLMLSAQDLRTFDPPEGIMCTWFEDANRRMREEAVKRGLG